MLKIARPCWMATTRRVVKLRPSRMRSTSKTIGMFGSIVMLTLVGGIAYLLVILIEQRVLHYLPKRAQMGF